MLKKINKAYALLFAISLLFLTSAEAQEPITKLKVVTEQANIRLRPDIGSIIIQQVPLGRILESTKKEGEWYLIRIQTELGEQASGYVHESMVKVVERPPGVKEEIVEQIEPEIKEKAEEKPQIKPVSKPPPTPRLPSESQFELCFLGGGNYVSGGDLNRGATGFADYYRDVLAVQGEGEIKPARLSYIFGGEFAFPLSPDFYMGLGLDYFLGEKESVVRFQDSSLTETHMHPRIQAFPIRLFITYYPIPSVYLKTGIEYYFAKCEYYYYYQSTDYWKEWRGKATAQGSGILGGVGLDLKLSPAISFTIEVLGRYSKISGFKGSDTSIDSDGIIYTLEGTLFFYQGITSGETSVPLLFIADKAPSEDVTISDPRMAIIDFSGISLKTGFRIRF